MRGRCLLQEDQLHFFVFLFGLLEWNFSEFMGIQLFELNKRIKEDKEYIGGLPLAFVGVFGYF